MRLKLLLASPDLKEIRTLIREGKCTGVVDEEGNTCLHIAAEIGRVDVVRLLVDVNSSTTTKNKKEITPIQSARAREQFRCCILSLLLPSNQVS